MDPETLEPLPVERLLHGLSAQLIGDLTSAAEQDQSLKQPFLEQLVPGGGRGLQEPHPPPPPPGAPGTSLGRCCLTYMV